MKKLTESYFTFSKKELNGFLVLFAIIATIRLLPNLYLRLQKPQQYDLDEFKKEIALFQASAKLRNEASDSFTKEGRSSKSKPHYFQFDPNTVTSAQWEQLGLTPGQIRVITNYRLKGGKFYKKEDLKKIYSITHEQYQQLEPHILIEKAASGKWPDGQRPPFQAPAARRKELVVELNSADSIQLDALRGVGPAFASRIIRYRARLGGFYSAEQLREVYGMDSVRYEQLIKQVTVDRSLIQHLNFNEMTFDELKRHPYLSYKQINAILQYRKQHGKYTTIADLNKVLILDEEIIRKIGPYISFDP